MRIDFDLGDLEAFLAVKEAGSFHGAAEALALSQSAVTRRVQKLEAALDSVLFERTTRKVKPTLAAKRLQARAEAILEDAREAARAMRDDSVAFAHQRHLVVTLAIIPTVVSHVVPAALRLFRKQGHGARIRLLDLATNEVADAVSEGEADFGVSALPTLDPGLGFERLFEEDIVLVLPAGHPLSERERVSWQMLGDEVVIVPARKTGNRVLIDDALARAGVTLRWSIETERSTTARALVAGGAGLAILPQSASQNPDDAAVVHRPLDTPIITRRVGILSRLGQHDSPETTALKSAIRSTCSSMW